METRQTVGLAEAGGNTLVKELGGKAEDIALTIRSIEVDRAIMWTTFASGADPLDPDWASPRLRTFWELKSRGSYIVPDGIFQTWRRQILRQFKLVAAIPAKHMQLQPLWKHEYPDRSGDLFWHHAPAVFVKNLIFGGSSAIIQGPKGSGKTGYAVWIAEQLNVIKEEYKVKESGSTLSRILRQQGRDDFRDRTEKKRRIGLANSDDLMVIANFSVYDDKDSTGKIVDSPIRKKHIRVESAYGYLCATSDCIYGPGGKYRYSIFEYDEAGVGYSKIRTMSRKNKTTQDMSRMTGKAGQGWVLMTHKEDVDLPDDVVESATTKVELLLPSGAAEPPKSGATGIFTVEGTTIYHTKLRGIPLPVSGYDTNETPAFLIDVDFEGALGHIAKEQGDAERAGREWGRKERAAAMKDAAWKFQISQQLMTSGRSPAQLSEAKFVLRKMPVNPATAKPWTDEEISAMTGADPNAIADLRTELEKSKREKETQASGAGMVPA